MFYFEKCYDLDTLATCNMHIHTHFSGCAKPEMTLPDILRECRLAGLRHIALVDHSNLDSDGQSTPVSEHNRVLKAELEALAPETDVRIGCELSLYGVGKLSDTPEHIKDFEYRLIAQNHYHMSFWEQPEDSSPRGYAQHMQDCLYSLFATDFGDCIAHPLVPVKKTARMQDPDRIPDCFTDNELGDLMAAGEAAGCAWELHSCAICGWPDFARRYFNIGREAGVHFNFATDAHRLQNIDTRAALEQFKKILL